MHPYWFFWRLSNIEPARRTYCAPYDPNTGAPLPPPLFLSLSFPLESDPADLEELLRGALVPWVRQKLKGKAPPEVCRWLLRLVGQHEVPTAVMAAEEALLQLLAEDGKARDGGGGGEGSAFSYVAGLSP